MIRNIFAKLGRFLGWGAPAAFALLLTAQCVQAQKFAPLFKPNWGTLNSSGNPRPIAPEGFGDRQNSWAWSMAWFNGKLLVGTARAEQCVTAYAEHLASSGYAYPPKDPALSCAADPTQLALQAEIWSYDPVAKTWTRVFQSPLTVPVPGHPGLMEPPDIGFRDMFIYEEPSGTEALYVSGCSAAAVFPGVPGGRLLRSIDGVNFAPVPQDPGTNLGNLANVCFRGMQSLNGQFFIMAVNYKGEGTVLQSPTPWLGDNTFQQISSPVTPAYEIGIYNNQLYVTYVNPNTGFSLARTTPTGPLPYTYTTVIPNGAYKPTPDPIALSMAVYDGYLYVGGDGVKQGAPLSAQGAELYRVFTDDSWDIVSGQSRSTPVGQKNSLSGLGIGFGWFLNQHMWRMAIYDSRLYVGTFDEAVWLRFEKGASAYQNEFGFDLWWTEDGTYFSQVDQQGFGDGYNMGVRTMEPTPYGLFLGTANPFYGLEVFRGINTTPVNLFGSVLSSSGSTAQSDAATPPSPPQHVQVEGGTTGALLSWDAPAGGAQRYRIFRRSYDPIDVKIVGVDSDAHPAYTHGEWEEVGVTDKATYVDTSASQFGQYAYQIKAENEGGLSEYSNFVTYPSAAPPTSFEDAWTAVNKLMVGGKFVDAPTRDAMLKLLAEAQDGAAKGEFAKLRTLWSSVKTAAGAVFSNAKDARDFELALSRLYKRAQLVQAGSLSASALAISHDATPPIAPNQLNCTATGIGGSLVCTQPTSGLGGSTYTNASVTVNGPYWANNRYTDNDFEYYIYEPGTPAPATAPVILFLHGYNAILPSDYLGWINQMVQNGYIVVWVQYQANLTSTFANYPTNAQAAWTDALYRLENYTWEPHVRPKKVNGVPQTLIVGHSFGGWIAAWLAGAASTSIPSFPIPRGLVLIEPASLGLLPAINFAGIDPGTRMLVLSGDQDTVACSKDGVSIFTSTTQIPAAQKNYLFYNSDNSGTPNQVGNHFFPNTYGYHDTAAIDNRDYYATYKLSVAAANCLTSQTSCGTFLGNGSTSQLYMGTWSNGTAIAPMTYYADPTQLPPITGCQQ